MTVELACLPSYHWRDAAAYPVWPGLREIGHGWSCRRRARFLIGQFANPRRLGQRAKATGADIIHLCNVNHLSYPYWSRLRALRTAKIAVTVHDIRRQQAIVQRAYEERQLAAVYRRADALFVHSRRQADELILYAGIDREKVHVVPHGPYDYGRPSGTRETIRGRLRLPHDKQVALVFGNLRDEKNLSLLLEALPQFKDSLHLLVAGRGGGGRHKGNAFYRTLAERLNLRGSVTFIDGYIPDGQVADLFTACDWVALPYSRRFTSQSGVLNVAVTYDRPVLVSGAPTLTETLESCDVGVLVAPDNVEQLRGGIMRIQQRLRRGDEFQFAQYRVRFSWRENANCVRSVYRSLVSRRDPEGLGQKAA